ncbi:hypothetical protein KY290_007533 [Solanum tuberosum]|uniref:Uncharacterized protein n=1 Tax=Solanum tuberosum TaxID=4113 RepID=A0ABQ7W5U6_SOLTU|nr:hypothetical protein KY290_007533 [Solanum tuberosum]
MALKFNRNLTGTLFSAVVIASFFLHASAALGGGKGDLLGETQVFAGTNYRLVISATDGGRRSRSDNKYLAEFGISHGRVLGISLPSKNYRCV